MRTADAIQYFETRERDPSGARKSGRVACAEALGITKAAVYNWGELVPPLSAALLEEITEGALKFDPYVYVAAGWHKPPHLRAAN